MSSLVRGISLGTVVKHLRYRLSWGLATAGSGFLGYRVALRLTFKPGPLVATLLFFTPPLQLYGLLALPNALMLLFSTVKFSPDAGQMDLTGTIADRYGAGFQLELSWPTRGRALPFKQYTGDCSEVPLGN